MPETTHIVRARAVPGVSHTEGLCGEVLDDMASWTSKILDSLGQGSFPRDRTALTVDVQWHGATENQQIDIIVKLAFRPLNTNGYYWVLVAMINSDQEVDLGHGEAHTLRCKLDGRHLIIARSGEKTYAWLLPEEFSLHNPLVRDMIFSDDREEEHRLIFTHLHALTSVFWRI